MVVVPVPLNCNAVGHWNSAQPNAFKYRVEVAVEEEATLNVAEVTVPDGENVFPVSVKVATRLFVARSILLATPDELLTTRKVRFEPVSEQN